MTYYNGFPIQILRGPVPLSHLLLQNFVRDGYFAVDATCGNGHDTLLLAQLVGAGGHVWAFDIQQQAINATGVKLAEASRTNRVTLIRSGHEELARYITSPVHAVLFNLGYLPGGDRNIITRPDTTESALKQSKELLMPNGIVIVTIYPGHNGGNEEQFTVENWASGLDPRTFHCWRMNQVNVGNTAPYMLFVQKSS